MVFVKAFGATLLCAAEIVILYFAFRSKSFFKTLLIHSILGLLSLTALKLTERITGVYIPINQYTVPLSATMGIPACLGILMLNLIFL